MTKKNLVLHLAAITAIIIVTLLYFRPWIAHSATSTPDPADAVYIAWTIRTVQDNLLQGRNLFSGNTFYPHTKVLAFSDLFVTSAIMALPLRLFTREPLTILVFSLITAQITTLISLYLLSFEFTKKHLTSAVIALVFAFSQVHLHYLMHLQVFALQYVILALFGLIRYEREGKLRWAALTCLMLVLQIWQSIFLAYCVFLFVPLLFLLPTFRKNIRQHWRQLCVLLVLSLLAISPVLMLYGQFYVNYHAVRDIREAINFSMLTSDIWGKFWSPGLYVLLFFAAFINSRKKQLFFY